MKSKRKKRWKPFMVFFIFPAAAIYTFFLLLPIVDSLRLSFYSGSGFIPTEFVGFDNYVKLFTEFPFKQRILNAFTNNIEFFIIVTIVQNIFGFFIAFLVTRKIMGNNFFRKISFLPTTLSVLVVGFLFKLILNPTWGIFDKMLTAIGLFRDYSALAWRSGNSAACSCNSCELAVYGRVSPFLYRRYRCHSG